MVAYEEYEERLLGLVMNLKGDLLDIEMELQGSLESARSNFVSHIKGINDAMLDMQTALSTEIQREFANFGVKLKEELNKER